MIHRFLECYNEVFPVNREVKNEPQPIHPHSAIYIHLRDFTKPWTNVLCQWFTNGYQWFISGLVWFGDLFIGSSLCISGWPWCSLSLEDQSVYQVSIHHIFQKSTLITIIYSILYVCNNNAVYYFTNGSTVPVYYSIYGICTSIYLQKNPCNDHKPSDIGVLSSITRSRAQKRQQKLKRETPCETSKSQGLVMAVEIHWLLWKKGIYNIYIISIIYIYIMYRIIICVSFLSISWGKSQ